MTIILQALLEAAITAEYGDTPARAELEQQLAANRAEVDRLNTVILAKDAAYAALQTEFDGVREANATLGEANRQLQMVIDSLKAQIETLNVTIGELRAEIVTLKASIAEQASMLEAQASTIADLEDRIEELEAGTPPDPPDEPDDPEEPPPPPPSEWSPFPIPAVINKAYLDKALQWYKDNTGARGVVRKEDGSLDYSAMKRSNIKSITTNGATYEDLVFTGTLSIRADNVTLRHCVVVGGDWNGVDAEGSDGLTLDHVTVIGARTSNYNNAILSGANSKILYCDVSGHQHGITPQGGPDTVVRVNFVHDPFMFDASKHVGGISIKGGSNFGAMLVEMNWIYGMDTSCIFIKNDFGSVANTTVQLNFMLHQPGTPSNRTLGYCAYSTADGKGWPNWTVSGTKFLDNICERGYAGYFSVYRNNNPQPVISGNVDLNGNPVNG